MNHIRRCAFPGILVIFAGLVPLAGGSGCAKVDQGASGPADAGAGVDAAGSTVDVASHDVAAPEKPPCVNLQCQQPACPGSAATSISGTVFAPNGKLPLYNVQVYIPNAPLAPFQDGVTCDRCSGAPAGSITSGFSDEQGRFHLVNAPAGKDIPVVYQVGKWRRLVTLPSVTACQDNAIADPDLTRLPRNRKEGDMPRIAVTTGTCDGLGCLLPKVGVDLAEIGIDGENKAVTFFRGGGVGMTGAIYGPANMSDVTPIWRSESELSKYDITLLSCECSEQPTGKGPMAYDAMSKYLAKGGRIFGSDFMYVWYRYSPDPMLAGALTIQGGAPTGRNPLLIDTTFPKGKAMADWMKFVDPMSTYGEIAAQQVFDNFTGAMPSAAQVWASSNNLRDNTPHPRIVTINTPVGVPAEQQCGRAVHLDAHISMRSFMTGGDKDFPGNCGTELNKGEEALAFLFFDLAACLPVLIP